MSKPAKQFTQVPALRYSGTAVSVPNKANFDKRPTTLRTTMNTSRFDDKDLSLDGYPEGALRSSSFPVSNWSSVHPAGD